MRRGALGTQQVKSYLIFSKGRPLGASYVLRTTKVFATVQDISTNYSPAHLNAAANNSHMVMRETEACKQENLYLPRVDGVDAVDILR